MEVPLLAKTWKRGRCFSFHADVVEVAGRVIAHLFPRERGRRLIIRYMEHAWVHFPIARAFNFEFLRRFDCGALQTKERAESVDNVPSCLGNIGTSQQASILFFVKQSGNKN